MGTHLIRLASVAALAGLASGAVARSGPDVTLQDIPGIATYGPIGGIYAYSIASGTCNIGDQNLLWTSFGTPALAMNAYRLHEGRLVQIGLGFCKTACCAGPTIGCGTCNGAGGNVLGAGCKDTYFAGWNAMQSRLAPRSAINAYTGAFTSFSTGSGDDVFKRLQVRAADLSPATYPGALYFVEGIYVGTDDAQSGNAMNNATYQRATVSNGAMQVTDSAQSTVPAIRAWRDHGRGPGVPDPEVTVASVDVPGEGRFWYAYKVTLLPTGWWRYDYAVSNLNSDRSGGSFRVEVPLGTVVSNAGFSAPFYHSGEVYSNSPWVIDTTGGGVTWRSPETFAQNPNSSALRWGTMYSFWFEANLGPGAVMSRATLGLFKPFSPDQVTFDVLGPGCRSAFCLADCDRNTLLNVNDFVCYQGLFASGSPCADCNGDHVLNVGDFVCFQGSFAGCN